MYRYRYRRRTSPGTKAVAVIGAVLVLGAARVKADAGTAGHASRAAREAIAYARHQLGLPYCWGGAGPSCYDCSGLVQAAYASAGVSIPRTTFQEWADLPHVPASQREPGDLVYAPGSDGSWSSPGHVGLLISGHRVIQAYGQGVPLEISTLAAFAAGAGGIVGYARPGGSP